MPPTPENNYQAGPADEFSRIVWNAVLLSIAQRLAPVEAKQADFDALIAGGTQAALDLIQANIAPQIDLAQQTLADLQAQLEAFIGEGNAPNALKLGDQFPAYYLALANATGMLPYAKVTGIDAAITAAIDALKGGASSALDTLIEFQTAIGNDPTFAATIANALGLRLRIDAAQALSSAQKVQALTNLGANELWRPSNRIINGCMRWSQVYGTANIDHTTVSIYNLDQWMTNLSTTPGGTMRVNQIASPTPGGSPNRMRLTAQVADASIAAGDYYSFRQPIEGQMIADARFGSAAAKQLIFRFGVKSSLAGTFGLFALNSAVNRTWLGSFTIAAGEINTDVVKSVLIPGDVTGTWATDTTLGLWIGFSIAGGSTVQGVAGWQAGNFRAIAGQTNFMGTAAATLEFFDVALYVDHLGLGIVPPYVLPDFHQEEHRIFRYLEYLAGSGINIPAGMVNVWSFKTRKRTTPIANMAGGSVFTNVYAGTDSIGFLHSSSTGSIASGSSADARM